MKRIVSGILLMFLLMAMFSLAFYIKPVKSEWTGTVYIRADGSIYPLDAPITTYDNITYTLIDNIISSDDGIIIEKHDIIIDGRGFEVSGTGVGIGMDLSNMINVTVKNTTIKNFQTGIRLFNARSNSIYGNNLITNKWYGIYIDNSNSSNIIRNNIEKNRCGICLLYSQNNSIQTNNIMANNESGIYLGFSYHVDIFKNNVTNNLHGIFLEFSYNNTIIANTITRNQYGIWLRGSNHSRFYHNNFIDNSQQIFDLNRDYPFHPSPINFWDDGYPSGGNYWSNYAVMDLYRGPYQNETGSDGIGDTPYVIDENNIDHYPLINPWTPKPVITSTVDIKPDVLNLGCRGIWVTAYVELPEGYNVSDINPTTLVLNNTILIDLEALVGIGDYNNDTIPDLMVKFNRATVCNFILSKGIRYGNVTLMLSGKLYDGTLFEGYDTIRVRMPGDINMDGKVDMKDISIASSVFGSYLGHERWNQIVDENEDNKIDIADIALICRNFGKTYRTIYTPSNMK